MKTLHTVIFVILGLAVFSAYSLNKNDSLSTQEDSKRLREIKTEFLNNLECEPNSNDFKLFNKTHYFDHKRYHYKLAESCLNYTQSDEFAEQYFLHHMLSGRQFMKPTKATIISRHINKQSRWVLERDNTNKLIESARARALKYSNGPSYVAENINRSRQDLDYAQKFLEEFPKGYEEKRIVSWFVFFCLFLIFVIPTIILRPFTWLFNSISKRSKG